ncbi:splicing factor 1 helix-hairpin domain-containing protein [Sarocladium implicatum]|nr:splicing factor 1 helix-hairpin domain-containing protein [Sarocladium implicatum]
MDAHPLTISASRWSPSSQKSTVLDDNGNALPSAIVASLTPEQLQVYAHHYRIREISLQLQLPDAVLDVMSPQSKQLRRGRNRSPDPEYDFSGRRTNTPIQRLRTALETERHALIEEVTAKLPSYRPPVGYRRPTHFTDRLFIPQAEYPSINFIGQILGPRGSSLRDLQARSGGANIVLRGKGSVKEGRMQRSGGKQKSGHGAADQSALPLHVLITAPTQHHVQEAKQLVQQVINDAIAEPDWMNERKKNQLRDLAIANGTFRDDEGRHQQQDSERIACTRRLPEHLSGDRPAIAADDSDFEEEYAQLMAEIEGANTTLGEDANAQQQGAQHTKIPPWRRP